jgi:hypothetical protein
MMEGARGERGYKEGRGKWKDTFNIASLTLSSLVTPLRKRLLINSLLVFPPLRHAILDEELEEIPLRRLRARILRMRCSVSVFSIAFKDERMKLRWAGGWQLDC